MTTTRSKARRSGRGAALLLAATLVSTVFGGMGCEYVNDRFRTCKDLAIDLVNSQQNREPVNLIAEDETFTADNLLAEGTSRRRILCVERGDRKRFRAARNGEVLGVANCVVSKAAFQYEVGSARVVWGPTGFSCENW